MTNDRAHWEHVYRTRPLEALSWHQPSAGPSLRLILEALPDRSLPVIDIGGGVSRLAGQLVAEGCADVTVLELASAAIEAARARPGRAVERVHWIEGDVRTVPLPAARYAAWHDRAVFHFLTDPADRAAYVRQVHWALAPGGVVILATFAEDGPTRCSGLEVRRYSAEGLAEELGDGFRLLRSEREEHRTPGGAVQVFTYAVLQRVETPGAA